MLVIGAGITELRWSKNQCRNSRNGGLSEWKAFFSMKKCRYSDQLKSMGRNGGLSEWQHELCRGNDVKFGGEAVGGVGGVGKRDW